MITIKTAYERFAAIPLCLGMAEENGVTEIRIDLSTPLGEYPGAWFGIAVENPEGVCYPAVAETDGDTLIWLISSADTAKSGRGFAQVVMYGENGEIGRSRKANTSVLPSIKATGNAPDPVAQWIDEALRLLEELRNYEVPKEQVEQIVRDYLEENPPAGGGIGEKELEAAIEKYFDKNPTKALPSVTEEDNGKILTVVGGEWAASELPRYSGTYEVTPQAIGSTTLETAQTFVESDIVVKQIPYYQTSNDSGGDTVYIGTEVEIYGN